MSVQVLDMSFFLLPLDESEREQLDTISLKDLVKNDVQEFVKQSKNKEQAITPHEIEKRITNSFNKFLGDIPNYNNDTCDSICPQLFSNIDIFDYRAQVFEDVLKSFKKSSIEETSDDKQNYKTVATQTLKMKKEYFKSVSEKRHKKPSTLRIPKVWQLREVERNVRDIKKFTRDAKIPTSKNVVHQVNQKIPFLDEKPFVDYGLHNNMTRSRFVYYGN